MSYSPDFSHVECKAVTQFILAVLVLCACVCLDAVLSSMSRLAECLSCSICLYLCNDRTVHISHSLHTENIYQQRKRLLPAARRVPCVCGVVRKGSLEARAPMRKLLPLL